MDRGQMTPDKGVRLFALRRVFGPAGEQVVRRQVEGVGVLCVPIRSETRPVRDTEIVAVRVFLPSEIGS